MENVEALYVDRRNTYDKKFPHDWIADVRACDFIIRGDWRPGSSTISEGDKNSWQLKLHMRQIHIAAELALEAIKHLAAQLALEVIKRLAAPGSIGGVYTCQLS